MALCRAQWRYVTITPIIDFEEAGLKGGEDLSLLLCDNPPLASPQWSHGMSVLWCPFKFSECFVKDEFIELILFKCRLFILFSLFYFSRDDFFIQSAESYGDIINNNNDNLEPLTVI